MNRGLFVDTWGWYEIFDQNSEFHRVATALYEQAIYERCPLYTTDYILDETITLLFKRVGGFYGNQAMLNLLSICASELVEVLPIIRERFENARRMRSQYQNRSDISFTDLTSMVVMQELGINTVLTQDRHFVEVSLGFICVPQV